MDGIDALSDETAQERCNRDGSPCPGLQYETSDEHPWSCRTGPEDQDLMCQRSISRLFWRFGAANVLMRVITQAGPSVS